MSNEKNSKVLRLVIIVIAIFFLSFLYTLIDNYPNYDSVFDFGKSTGQVFGQMLKILGLLGLIVLSFRYFKKELLK